MSDAVFDRGVYFPSPMTDWYRERPFKVAFVLSLLIHAALLAFVPGFRGGDRAAPGSQCGDHATRAAATAGAAGRCGSSGTGDNPAAAAFRRGKSRAPGTRTAATSAR